MFSTPNGKNHFYKMVQLAKRGKGYTFFEVHWRDVPRSDDPDTFKSNKIAEDGIVSWNQEYECVCGDTYVTVEIDGVISTITIEELYSLI